MSGYASFDKTNGTINFTYPVILGGNAVFQGRPLETVTTPSFSWSNNTTTGLYLPVSNTIGVVTAGVSRIHIGNNGSIGIGTTVPRGILDVHTTRPVVVTSLGNVGFGTTVPRGVIDVHTNRPVVVTTLGNVGFGTTAPRGIVDIHSTNPIVVSTTGNIGIGTTTPRNGFILHTLGFSIMQPIVAILEERYTNSYKWCDNEGPSTTAPTVLASPPLTWRTRGINTYMVPSTSSTFFTTNIVDLNTNTFTFTIPTGTYHIYAEGNGIACGKHRIALVPSSSTSPGVNDVHGTSEFANPVSASDILSFVSGNSSSSIIVSTKSTLSTVITVSSSTGYKLMHYTDRQNTVGAFGIPVSVNSSQETYARIVITKYQ